MSVYIAQMIDELYELGIRDVVLSPGARSTPLSMLVCEHKFSVYMNVDERSAAFFALGIAKEYDRPVVVICTSGSATAHYLPAAIEAKHSRIPLIFLTADRPPELQNVGAPQTINQYKILGEFIKFYDAVAIPNKDDASTCSYPRTVMQLAYIHAQSRPKGPVQINVPLREPLVPDCKPEDFIYGRSPFSFVEGETRAFFDVEELRGKRGVIICGGDAQANYHQELITLATHLNAPLLADPLSNFRAYQNDIIIDSYDAFLKSDRLKADLRPDYVLLFGQTPVSKRLYQFLSLHSTVACYQIDDVPEYRNPTRNTTQIIQSSPKQFVLQLLEQIAQTDIHRPRELKDSSYLCAWVNAQKAMRTLLESAKTQESLFEGKIVQLVQALIPAKSTLCIANSMPIRDVDFFWKAQNQEVKILCNRGANGIDGTISTALGVATNQAKKTVLLTGDLAFFHDINGILLGKTHKINLVIVLLNNNGGGIFQYLPQAEARNFEYLFTTPHDMNFQAIEQLFGVSYECPSNYQDFERMFTQALAREGIQIIEVHINMQESKKLHNLYTTPQ